MKTEVYQVGEVVAAGAQSYKLVRRLGDGTFGTVYEALDLLLKRGVAIKLLRPHLGADFASRMRREWETLARLRHPNIVQVLSAGFTTDRGVPFLTMPLLTGAPLRAVLKESGALPFDRALDLGVELFSALGEAHRERVVHRDVKPENILLERASPRMITLKLLDFGLVCSSSSRTATAQGLRGTPQYAAPELFYGDPPSPKSDLYSAGIVLFEMLTGIHPLTSASRNWRRLHSQSRPMSLEDLMLDPPAALADLQARLLSKLPHDRPVSATGCAAQLQAVIDAGMPNKNTTDEDAVDSKLRGLAGPASDEITQPDPPSFALLHEAGLTHDTDVDPPPSSESASGL